MWSSTGWPWVLKKLSGVESFTSKLKNRRMDTEAVDSSTDGFVLEDTKSSDKCWTTTIIRREEL